MTYLELCQFAHRYIGGGNDLPGTAPTTVIGQVGYLFELVKSVADAYRSIQNNRDDWLFMQKQGTFALASGGRVITQAAMVVQVADYGDLRPDLYGAGYRFMQMYANASGVGSNAPVLYLPYQQWRGTIDQQTIPTGRANMVTIQPNRSIEFNYIADQDYTFLCDYKVKIDTWVQTASGSVPAPDAQTPIFPERFHEVVAWRAVMLWGGSVEDPGKYQFARDEYNRIMTAMYNDQIPENLPYLEAFDGGCNTVGGWY